MTTKDLIHYESETAIAVSYTHLDVYKRQEYPNGNGVVCQIGHFDNQTGQFHSISSQSVDYGIDFYAPQTLSLIHILL